MQKSIENEVLSALRRLIRATDLDAKKLARNTGLTTSQLLVLEILAAVQEKTIGTIADEVGLAQGTVTVMIDRLERLGLVARRRGFADRRLVKVRVTDAGRHLVEEAPTLLQKRFLQKFASLRDWEKHTLLASLQHLADLMDAEDIDAAPVLDVGRIDRQPG